MQSIATSGSVPMDKTEFWPEAARKVLSSLDNQFPPLHERRKIARHRYHISANLHFGGTVGAEASIYVRDVNTWAVGFLTPTRIASHAKATVAIETPDGQMLKTRCLIRRIREVSPGWFDGVLEFDMPQAAFSNEAVRRVA